MNTLNFNMIEAMGKELPILSKFGIFQDQSHYLDAVDMLIGSTLETQHRDEILTREILPNLKSFSNMLDIGVGNGDLTKNLGKLYSNITVIDNSQAALANVPDYNNQMKTEKIFGSVTEVAIPNKNYDLVVLSHVLYYIEPEFRNLLINKLYSLMSEDGKLLLIFNEGLNRYELTKHFGGHTFEFTDFIEEIQDSYQEVNIIESKETITTQTIEPMLHIAGVCLKDASTSASKEDLTDYLELNHHTDDFYHIDMIQKIILIGKSVDIVEN